MLPRSLRDRLVSLACRALSLALRTRTCAPAALPEDARIAVLKPCCLGDVIMSTAAVASLRARYPHAHLTYVTGAWSAPAVESSPLLNAVLQWEWSPESRLRAFWRLLRLLRSGRYHAALVLDRSPLLGLAAWLAGIPVRAGMDAQGRGFSLTHPATATPGRHEAQLYLDAAAALGADPTQGRLSFTPTPADAAWAAATLGDAPWVSVHPGGGVNPGSTLTGKRWAPARFAELIARLRAAGHPVLLVGSPHDALPPVADPPGAAPLLDLTGRTTLGQLGAALARCRLFVGNDTGPMHLAVAVGVPVVAVFGPSRPAWYRPFTDRARVVYHGEACAACSFRGGLVARCMNGFRCMDLATVDEVWRACQDLLAEASVSTPQGGGAHA